MPRGNPNLVPGVSGNPNGRPKGSKNEFTTLKEAFIEAFKEIGGKDALVQFYKNNRRGNKKAMLQMIANMLPKDIQVSGADGKPLDNRIIIVASEDKIPQEDKEKKKEENSDSKA
jgi:hypothetical protein